MPTFIVTMDGRLSEHDEHTVLKNKNVIRITAASYLIRNCDTAQLAIDSIIPHGMDKSLLMPWYVFQVMPPWTGKGAEQDCIKTPQRVIAFLKIYPEDSKAPYNPFLQHMSDDELDSIVDQPEI
ncbi:MAG: hypothetical protein WC449_05965 [Candidatus Paceibacterota bacterium]